MGRSHIATDTPEKGENKSYKKTIKNKKEHKATDNKYVRKVLRVILKKMVKLCYVDSADDGDWWTVFYVAKVLEKRNNEQIPSELLQQRKGQFTMPNGPDLSYAKDDNIKTILPNPTLNGSTARQQSYLTFGVNLSGFNIR